MEILKALHWIESEQKHFLSLLIKWCEINSGSQNQIGLKLMEETLIESFSPLADQFKSIQLPSNDHAVSFIKRSNAKRKILLAGHMDTVFPVNSLFQTCKKEGDYLIGPGVADMKGGLIVLLIALQALEKFSNPTIGWEVFITPDEEIGSIGSAELWEEKAKEYEFALLFEPSFPDGAIVNQRKGSLDLKVHIKGKAAHAGRDFHLGISAIKALAHFIKDAYFLSEGYPGLSMNSSHLESDNPANVVAENAACHLNLRSFKQEDLVGIKNDLHELAKIIEKETKTEIVLQMIKNKEPKANTPKTQKLFQMLELSAKELNMTLQFRDSGGLSDGNILAKAGLPNLDSLGVIGGNLHTSNEYMEIQSMVERAKLTFLFLTNQAENKYAAC